MFLVCQFKKHAELESAGKSQPSPPAKPTSVGKSVNKVASNRDVAKEQKEQEREKRREEARRKAEERRLKREQRKNNPVKGGRNHNIWTIFRLYIIILTVLIIRCSEFCVSLKCHLVGFEMARALPSFLLFLWRIIVALVSMYMYV